MARLALSPALGAPVDWRVLLPLLALGPLLAWRLPAPGMASQLWVCGPAIAVFGLPHGATDWAIGAEMLRPRLGRRWYLAFAAFYGVLMVLAAAGAAAWPQLTMVIFLAMAIWHFGAEDAAWLGLRPGAAAILVCGALPVLLPAVAWPAQYAAILRELGVLSASASLALSARLGVFAAWLVLAGWSFVRGGARRVDAAAEWLCLLLLQWSLPPLAAFTGYFCALHGPRHMRGLGRSTADRQTIVVSAAAVAILAGAAWVAASWHHAGLIWAGTNGIFWGLAALTLPHVIFGRLAAWLAGRDQGGFDASRGW